MKSTMLLLSFFMYGCSTAGQPPTVFEQYMLKRASNPSVNKQPVPEWKSTTCRRSGDYINCTTF